MAIDMSERFRDDSGRFIDFDIEMLVGNQRVCAQGTVSSARRISQKQCGLAVRLKELDQGGYRTIAEYIDAEKTACQDVIPDQMAG